MKHGRTTGNKPFDIRERAFQFVLAVIAAYPSWRTLDAPSRRAWWQLFDAASSGGAHLEEANSASSHKHFTSLNRGALRELSEAKYWLRVIIAGRLQACQHADALAVEASELVAIVTTIVKRAAAHDEQNTKRR